MATDLNHVKPVIIDADFEERKSRTALEWIEGGGGGKGGGSVHLPVEEPNTLRSRSLARVVDLVSEGQIVGLVDGYKSIFFDDTPVQAADGTFNFQGITAHVRYGAPDQLPIRGFADAEAEINVNVEVKKAIGPFNQVITDPDVTAVRLKIRIPQLFKQASNGDLNEFELEYKVSISGADGVNFRLVFDFTGDDNKLVGKNVSPYLLDHRIELPTNGPPWTIRVERVSEDETATDTQNSLFVDTYTEIIDSNLMYADSAVLAMEVNSQLFGGRIPRRAYEIKGLIISVPSNYDPDTRVYTGIWDGTFKLAWSNNPAWVLYDLLSNDRYGLGDLINTLQIDKWALFTIGKYCDENVDDGSGGQEPRFVLNTTMSNQEEAYKVINTITSVFSGMAYWAQGAIGFSQDSPATASRVFGPANVVDGSFNYEGSALKARHTVALVGWNDPLEGYELRTEVVEFNIDIQKVGWRPVSVIAYGATSRGQAHRLGKWILDSERNSTEVCTFKTGMEHADVFPGEVVAIADPAIAGIRLGGRVVSVSGVDVTLDQNHETGLSEQIMLTMDDGTIETISIVDHASSNVVTMTATPKGTIAVNAMYIIQTLDVVPTEWRVITIKDMNDGTFDITVLRHDATKYARIESDILFEAPPTSLFPTGAIGAPTNLSMVEALYKVNNSLKTRILFSFTAPDDPRAGLFKIRVKEPGSPWTVMQISPSVTFEVLDAKVGLWSFDVTALTGVSGDSFESNRESETIQLLNQQVLGKTKPPDDVTGLVAERFVDGVKLTWTKVTDLDLVLYEVRTGTDWDIAAPTAIEAFGTQKFIPITTPNTLTFLVKAKDELEIFSDNAAVVQSSVIPPGDVTGFLVTSQGENISASWDQIPGSGIEYELRQGITWQSGQFIARTKATELTTMVPILTATDKIFQVKAVSAAGLFSANAVFYSVGMAPISNRNIILTQDEAAGTWAGLKNGLEIITGNVLALTLTAGLPELRGEYIVAIDLGSNFRARNWVETRMVLVSGSPITWAQATFQWNQPEALAVWLPTADIDGATVELWLAESAAIPSDVFEGWPLELDLIGDVLGTTANEAIGGGPSSAPEFASARYRDGLVVDDASQVSWLLSVPNEFTMMFTIKHTSVPAFDVVYATLQSVNGDLILGYDATLDETYFEDRLGNRVSVAYNRFLDAFAVIGITQNATDRQILVHDVRTDTILDDSLTIGPHNTITEIGLYAAA